MREKSLHTTQHTCTLKCKENERHFRLVLLLLLLLIMMIVVGGLTILIQVEIVRNNGWKTRTYRNAEC